MAPIEKPTRKTTKVGSKTVPEHRLRSGKGCSPWWAFEKDENAHPDGDVIGEQED